MIPVRDAPESLTTVTGITLVTPRPARVGRTGAGVTQVIPVLNAPEGLTTVVGITP